MTPSSTPHAIPLETIIFGPPESQSHDQRSGRLVAQLEDAPRAARQPPVMKPEIMAFQGSDPHLALSAHDLCLNHENNWRTLFLSDSFHRTVECSDVSNRIISLAEMSQYIRMRN